MALPTPLTTVFTPAGSLSSSCLSNQYAANGGSAIILGPGTSCIPDPIQPSFYSPGLYCPDQWTVACSTTVAVGSLTETRATCCPRAVGLGPLSGISFFCQPDSNDPVETWFAEYGCTMTLGSLAASVPLTYTVTTGAAFSTVTAAILSDQGLNAYSVQIRWQASDTAALATTTAATSSSLGSSQTSRSSTSTAAISNSAPATSSTNASSSSLSTSAKIAIGVAIPVVVIAALLIGICLFCRKKKKSNKTHHENRAQPSATLSEHKQGTEDRIYQPTKTAYPTYESPVAELGADETDRHHGIHELPDDMMTSNRHS